MERVFEFYKLYLPSALAIASDFWRVTVIGVIAANRGSLEVGELQQDCIYTAGRRNVVGCIRWYIPGDGLIMREWLNTASLIISNPSQGIQYITTGQVVLTVLNPI